MHRIVKAFTGDSSRADPTNALDQYLQELFSGSGVLDLHPGLPACLQQSEIMSTPGRAKRGTNKKRPSPESDRDDCRQPILPSTQRLRKTPVKQRGGQHNQAGTPREEYPRSQVVSDPSTQPEQDPLLNNEGASGERRPPVHAHAGQSAAASGIVVDLICEQPTQPAQVMKEWANRASGSPDDLGNLFERFHKIMFYGDTQIATKYGLLVAEVIQFVEVREAKTQREVSKLKHEAQIEIANCKHQVSLEIANSNNESLARLLNENILLKHRRPFEEDSDNLRSRGCSVGADPNQNAGPSCVKQVRSMSEIMRKSLSDKALEQEKWHVQGHDSCIALKATGKEQTTGKEQITGSYTDESPKPPDLNKALVDADAAVTMFTKRLVEFMDQWPNESWKKFWDMQEQGVYVARPNHSGYHFRSVVNSALFDGFENESFNTLSGASRFLDPIVRQKKFFEYHQNLKDVNDLEDSQFEEFYKARVSSLFLKEVPGLNVKDGEVICFEDPELAATFRTAAIRVWLLHKLAFSFEPPTSIIRVEPGANVDPNYMDTVVKVEDSDHFVPKVGFMVRPGLRLRKAIIRCEVYLAGSSNALPD